MSTVYMNLQLPTVTVTPGPEWAQDINDALSVIDDHDHTTGKGRKITSQALDINADLDIQNHNIDSTTSLRLVTQSTPLSTSADVNSLYSVSGDLYYNNLNGDQIRVTSGAGLNASTIGGFGGDYGTSNALASYSSLSTLFTFTQDTNIPAGLDMGSLTIRESGATSPNGITLLSPNALSASYSLIYPSSLPTQKSFLALQPSGLYDYFNEDDSTIEVTGSNVIQVKANGITNSHIIDDSISTGKIINANVTLPKLATDSVDNSKIVDNTITESKILKFSETGPNGGNLTAVGDNFIVTSITPSQDLHNVLIIFNLTHGAPGASSIDNLYFDYKEKATGKIVICPLAQTYLDGLCYSTGSGIIDKSTPVHFRISMTGSATKQVGGTITLIGQPI